MKQHVELFVKIPGDNVGIFILDGFDCVTNNHTLSVRRTNLIMFSNQFVDGHSVFLTDGVQQTYGMILVHDMSSFCDVSDFICPTFDSVFISIVEMDGRNQSGTGDMGIFVNNSLF
eukprot:Lithocolla_globosa_v1_NODE_1195_length_2795_cov_83.101095.p3 type:complete len:116 gc:universal NODE_1195_length_2795_cov_83.101095:1979-2326(+)